MVCYQDDKKSADATLPTLSSFDVHIKNAVVQRAENGAFFIGAG